MFSLSPLSFSLEEQLNNKLLKAFHGNSKISMKILFSLRRIAKGKEESWKEDERGHSFVERATTSAVSVQLETQD